METTRIIRLAPGIERERSGDEVTQIAVLDEGRPENIRVSFEVAFKRHFRESRAMLAERREPGVLLAAVAPGAGLFAHVWLKADEGVRAATVGRHSRADFYLPGDAELSLPNLVVLVRLVDGRPHVRVVDLRSGGGLELEDGTPVGGLRAEGPVFFGAARYDFFCFPTPVDPPWGDDPEAVWASLPPRTVQGEPVAPDARLDAERHRRLAVAQVLRPETGVTLLGRPLGFRDLALGAAEPEAGVLHIVGDDREERIRVDRASIRRGLVIGRYSRCDNTVDLDEGCLRLSRVHALVVEEGGQVWLVDTASTNGTWIGERAVSVVCLKDGVTARLPGLGTLRWEPR